MAASHINLRPCRIGTVLPIARASQATLRCWLAYEFLSMNEDPLEWSCYLQPTQCRWYGELAVIAKEVRGIGELSELSMLGRATGLSTSLQISIIGTPQYSRPIHQRSFQKRRCIWLGFKIWKTFHYFGLDAFRFAKSSSADS